MATFTVDPSTLSELSRTLGAMHAHMQAMHGVASGYEGLLGGSDLDAGVREFCGTWGYGIGKLGDHMGKVVQRLDHAHEGYSSSEQAIQRAASAGGHR